MCQAALARGLKELAVTDHYDVNTPPPDIDFPPADMASVYKDINEVKDKYEGRLKLLFGIELGQPTQNEELALKLLKEREYDFVIGSLHNVENEPDFYFIDYEKSSKNELLRLWDKYLEETLSHIQWGRGRFHTMAHFGYLLRYYKKHGKGELVSFADKKDIIYEIFKKTVDCGIALEINTSGLRQGLDECIPSDYCLSLYKEAGGSMFTVGSDAHRAEHIGIDIAEGLKRIKALGIDHIMVSSKGKLIEKRIDI